MTTEQVYNDFLIKLEQVYEKREAVTIADWIFEDATGLKNWERRLHKNMMLQEDVVKKIQDYLRELLQNKPIQYVLSEAWFYKMKFFVNHSVLIPRPETEELVTWIVNDVELGKSSGKEKEPEILDIGTGSGCRAISLKKEFPGSIINAIDVSEDALLVAKKNAGALDAQIDFLKIDFLDESAWAPLGMYDIIVSNPPYIPEKEKATLAKNVTMYEPAVALFVQNGDPYIFYKKMAKFARSHLKPGGKIFVEIHENFWREISRVFEQYDFRTEIKEDIFGKKRMIKMMSLS
jgi:release factor glutamine methyltransferase